MNPGEIAIALCELIELRLLTDPENAQRQKTHEIGEQARQNVNLDRVSCRDDEGLSSADIRFKGEPTTLTNVTGVNVPPQVPLSQHGILGERRKALIVLGQHHVREAQPHKGNATPAIELACHLF